MATLLAMTSNKPSTAGNLSVRQCLIEKTCKDVVKLVRKRKAQMNRLQLPSRIPSVEWEIHGDNKRLGSRVGADHDLLRDVPQLIVWQNKRKHNVLVFSTDNLFVTLEEEPKDLEAGARIRHRLFQGHLSADDAVAVKVMKLVFDTN